MNENVAPPAGGEAWRRVAERVAAQQWPPGTLYVVATPIGNLGDLSLRAWETLVRADVIAAEDTRESRTLMDAWGIGTPLMAAHRHNEAAAAHWYPMPARRPSAIPARASCARCAPPATPWFPCRAPARSLPP